MSIHKLQRLITKTSSHEGIKNVHEKQTHQISIYETFAEHEIGQELKTVSE